MVRLYNFVHEHRNMLKVIVVLVAVVATTLGAAHGALADGDGFSP